jgi:hypothetical protein
MIHGSVLVVGEQTVVWVHSPRREKVRLHRATEGEEGSLSEAGQILGVSARVRTIE